MVRYDYRCTACGHSDVLKLPIASSANARKCPSCHCRTFKRQLDLAHVAACAVAATGGLNYKLGRFPYISHSLPFKAKQARKHVGPCGACVVESKHMEDELRGAHGYVGEDKIG